MGGAKYPKIPNFEKKCNLLPLWGKTKKFGYNVHGPWVNFGPKAELIRPFTENVLNLRKHPPLLPYLLYLEKKLSFWVCVWCPLLGGVVNKMAIQ